MKVLILTLVVMSASTLSWAMIAEGPSKVCGSEKEEFKCMGEKIAKPDLYMRSKQECLTEKIQAIAADKKDRQKGITCLVVCEWQKYGILDKNGKFDEDKSDELLKSMNFSPALTKKLNDTSVECFKKHGAQIKYDPQDKTCSGFRDIVMCEFNAFMKTCNDKYDPEDWAM